MNRELTDEQRVIVAKMEYQLLKPQQELFLNQRFFGRVWQHVYTASGFQMYVVVNRPLKEYTLLFKGSSGIVKGSPRTWTDEWLTTNFPIGWSLLFQRGSIPTQLRDAAQWLNRLCKQFPQAHFYLYGHSLGSINLQYALSCCRHIGQIKRASLYEGPNIFELFNHRERHHVRKFKHKVDNYIDVYDPIVVGYVDRRHMVGKLRYVQSRRLPPITQHMWGGYQFDSQGKLLTKPIDTTFIRRAQSGQQWMASGHELYSKGQRWSRRQQQQIDNFHRRLGQVLQQNGLSADYKRGKESRLDLTEWLEML